jgi:hypothetical protein
MKEAEKSEDDFQCVAIHDEELLLVIRGVHWRVYCPATTVDWMCGLGVEGATKPLYAQ